LFVEAAAASIGCRMGELFVEAAAAPVGSGMGKSFVEAAVGRMGRETEGRAGVIASKEVTPAEGRTGVETKGTAGATASEGVTPAEGRTGVETEGRAEGETEGRTGTADRQARPREADLSKNAAASTLLEPFKMEAAGVSLPAPSMVEEGLVVSELTAAPAPKFCACGATTGRSKGVVEEALASRASDTPAPSLSQRALTHTAAAWQAAPPAPAHASGLICDRVSMSSRGVQSGPRPAGEKGSSASSMIAGVRDKMC